MTQKLEDAYKEVIHLQDQFIRQLEGYPKWDPMRGKIRAAKERLAKIIEEEKYKSNDWVDSKAVIYDKDSIN